MAATLAVNSAPSGGQKSNTTVTVTVAGHTATTAYQALISTPSGFTMTVNFKTNGSGAATFTFIPPESGTYTITSYVAAASSSASTTVNVGGHC